GLGGDFAFSKDGDDVVVIASEAYAKVEAGTFAVGIENGTLGLVINTDDTMALEASGSFDLTGGSFANISATSVGVRYNDTGIAYTGTELSVDGVTYTFEDMPASTELMSVSVEGLAADFAGFLTLGGNFGFSKDGNDIQVVATEAYANVTAGTFSVGIENGNLGLIINADDTMALEASGSFSLTGGSFTNVTAVAVTARYNDTGVSYTGTEVSVDSVTYTFTDMPASTDLMSVSVEGLAADFAGFLTLGGNFGFSKDGDDIHVVASEAYANVSAGTFSAGISNGSLGLVINSDDTMALEASGGFSIVGGGFANISAASVSVKYNNTGTAYTGETISVDGVDYTFADLPASTDLMSLSVVDLAADFAGFVSLGGDFGFFKDGAEVKATASDVYARIEAGSFSAGVSDGTLGLVLNDDDTIALEASGSFDIVGGGFASVSATSVGVRYNDTGTEYTGVTLDIGGVEYTFEDMPASTDLMSVSVVGLDAQFAGFVTLGGDFGFRKDGEEVQATASGVYANVSAGSFSAGVSGGELGFVLNADDTMALEASGAFSVTGGGFANVSADNVFVQYNDSGVSYTGTTLDIDGVDYTFLDLPASTDLMGVSVENLAADLAGFVRIGGSFAFLKDGDEVHAAASDAYARLEAGTITAG
ncbi:hypothetical protein L0Y59_03800, partial [Candidatus Uhrbacteria bacterium]|nr:hypothetical protein [Candidatus Uhrbacteria bacterium]